jgi:hypothetical protein
LCAPDLVEALNITSAKPIHKRSGVDAFVKTLKLIGGFESLKMIRKRLYEASVLLAACEAGSIGA